METCIYKVDYVYRCPYLASFSNDHEIAYVEAPKGIFRLDMEKRLVRTLEGFRSLNSFHPLEVTKLAY